MFTIDRKKFKVKSLKSRIDIDKVVGDIKGELERKSKQVEFNEDYSIEKYRKIFAIAKKFISKSKLAIYGGFALNLHLPRDKKIYKSMDFVDLDVYTDDPMLYSRKLVDLFIANGYISEARMALNKKTIRVFVEFMQIVDFSFMPSEQYGSLKVRNKGGYKVVSLSILMGNMYRELALPLLAPFRLEKTFHRSILLPYPTYTLVKCDKFFNNDYKDPKVLKYINSLVAYSRKEKLLHYGPIAYNTFIRVGEGSFFLRESMIKVLTSELEKTTNEMEAVLKAMGITNIKITRYTEEFRDVNNKCVSLSITLDFEELLIAEIRELNTCVGYKYRGKRIVAIDYLKFELYSELNFYNNTLSCMIRYLDFIQQQFYVKNRVSETDNTLFQRLVVKCKGKYSNLFLNYYRNFYLNKLERKKEIKDFRILSNDITFKNVQKSHIRIYPNVESKCIKHDKKNCLFPCYWDNTCNDIPFNYNPDISIELKEVKDSVNVGERKVKIV